MTETNFPQQKYNEYQFSPTELYRNKNITHQQSFENQVSPPDT
jgi:hypothetical protein